MKMKNSEIYSTARVLNNFNFDREQRIPAKVSFYLTKNIKAFVNSAMELEQARIDIIKNYGSINEEEEIRVDEDKVELAQKELDDLFSTEQEIECRKIPLSWFNDIDLTVEEIDMISFMIEDDILGE